MGAILKGKLKVATNNPDEILTGTGTAKSYAVLHPETDPEQIIGFKRYLATSINEFFSNAINIIEQSNGYKKTIIPNLYVDTLNVQTIISNSDEHLIFTTVANAQNDEDGRNIKRTYATKAEVEAHNFTVGHIIDFSDEVNELLNKKIHAEGLDAFLPLIGGTIHGNVVINGTLEVTNLDSKPATRTSKGLVQIGSNLMITNGIIDVEDANDEKSGIMKLYHSRGTNNDGTLSQNAIETSFHNILDQVDSVYQKKNMIANRAMSDEYGNRISEIYLQKDTEKITQANKLNVVPDMPENNPTYKEFSFKINNTSYAFPPVSVLKLDTSSDDISKSIFTFDNSDATSFIYESELNDDDPFRSLVFDNKMHLRKTYNLTFTIPEQLNRGFISYSDVIPLNRFRKKYSITTDTNYNDTTVTIKPESYKLFLSNNALYTSTGLLITENWSIASNIAKENYFLQYTDRANEFTAIKLLEQLGLTDIQVLIYTTESNLYHTGEFKALPNKKVVLPKGLIQTAAFSSLLNINMTYQLIGNSNVKIAVSPNLEDWYTYKLNIREWQQIPIEKNDTLNRYLPTVAGVEELGIPIHMIHTIGTWNLFTSNIAFCYLLLDENMESNASVNDVELTATIRGSWQYYPNIDYYYTNDNLTVKVHNPGSYKINYKRY